MTKLEGYLGCPQQGSILQHYGSRFDTVFVLLHPFILPKTINPERFHPNTYPSNREILADCEAIMWKDFVQTSKFGNLAELDVGLRSYFQALRSPNRLFISWLGRAMENRRVAPPFHGELDPFIEKAFVSTLQDSGHAELLTADEFGDNLSKRSIKGTEIDQTLPIHGVLSTVDQNTILTTHWDSCCSFLCTNDKAISDKALYSFEGFKCTKQTDVYWGLH